MKKYTQIFFVAILFVVIVYFRRQNGGDINTATNSSISTNTSSPDNSSQNISNQQSSGSSVNNGAASNNSSGSTGSSSANNMPMMQNSGKYKNGVYAGSIEDAYFGNVQVQATVSNGKISDISFLQYPNENSTSKQINSQAMPTLKSEALKAQSAQVDGVSGASYTSQAFQNSLDAALQKAV